MSNIMNGMIMNYTGMNRTTEHTWDYVQRKVSWSMNFSIVTFPISNCCCKMTEFWFSI